MSLIEDLREENLKRKEKTMNLKIEQNKVSNLRNTEKKTEKVKSTSVTCRTI